MAVILLTVAAYARHRGCDEKAVRKAIRAGRISTIMTPQGVRIDPAVADIQWAANTRARGDAARPTTEALPGAPSPAPVTGPPDPAETGSNGYSVDRARRERYEADMAQLKLQEQQGDLVRVVEVRAEIASRVGQVRTNLLQIPARLAPLLVGETDQAKIHAQLDAELRAVLASLSAPVAT